MKDGSIHYIAGKIKSRNVSANVVFFFSNEDIRALYQRLKDKSCHVLAASFSWGIRVRPFYYDCGKFSIFISLK